MKIIRKKEKQSKAKQQDIKMGHISVEGHDSEHAIDVDMAKVGQIKGKGKKQSSLREGMVALMWRWPRSN